jgi:hypothetical protein
MTSMRPILIFQILIAVTTTIVASNPAFGADAVSNVPPVSVVGTNTINSLANAYGNLQTAWDDCYKIKSQCNDLLNEGRNAPARKKWVDYYASTIEQSITDLQNECDKMSFPSDLQQNVSQSWADVRVALKNMHSSLLELQTQAAKVKSPNDDRYPAIFWGASGGIADSADKLDNALVKTLAVLDTSRDNALLTMSQSSGSSSTSGTSAGPNTNGVSGSSATLNSNMLKGAASKLESGTGLNAVSEAAQRTRKSCFEFFGELERFNLLFANPPKGEQSNMFYGGAFTKQEVLSQYKYLPNLVFTSAPYVKLFSYRLPPRQNMLASYTRQIGKLLNLIESELNDVHIPTEKEQAVAAPWEAVKAQFVDARQQYLNLYKLVEAASDQRLQANITEDQSNLGQPTMKIYNDMEDLIVAAHDVTSIISGK